MQFVFVGSKQVVTYTLGIQMSGIRTRIFSWWPCPAWLRNKTPWSLAKYGRKVRDRIPSQQRHSMASPA